MRSLAPRALLTTMPTMLCKLVGPFLVCVHGQIPPTDAEWNAMLELLQSLRSQDRARVLVSTAGGVPNGLQRAKLNKITDSLRVHMSLMTDSVIARAIGATALHWFDTRLQIFGSTEVEEALTHIEAMGGYRQIIRSTLHELRTRLQVFEETTGVRTLR